MPSNTLSIIIVNWNTAAFLRDCLTSFQSNVQPGAEIIVIDNHSEDDSVVMVKREFPSAHIIENSENVGFARANNQGIAASTGKYVLLLNSDTVVSQKTLSGLVEYMEQHPQVGVCSPRLTRPDRQAQAYAFGDDPTPFYLIKRTVSQLLFRRPLHDWATTRPLEVEWVSGACMMVRRTAIEQVGGLDEQIFMYFEDNDWCRRIRLAGWKIVYYPQVAITHIGGQSLQRNPKAQAAYYTSLRYFYHKHYGWFANLWLTLFLPLYRSSR